MANLKFSGFTANAAVDQADSFLVGFDTDGGGANPTNNKWTFPQIAAGLAAVTATPFSIYAANGTIGASRVATITDFPKFSGTQGNPIGLELENTQTGSGALTTLGAQLKLTSNSATATIGYFNGGGGGTSAPALVLDSPARVVYEAGADTGYQFLFTQGSPRGQFKLINELDAGKYIPIFESIVGGGGSNYSELRLAKTGTTYTYIRSVHNDANNICSLGRTVSGTYGEAIRINQANQLGINSDGLTISETLHVNGNARIDGQAYTDLHTNATNLVVNWNDGNVQAVTISGSAPTFAPTNPKAGATYILTLTQGATPVTVDFNSLVKWSGGAPTLSSTTGQIDVITLICYNDSGSGLYYGAASLNLA